MPLSDTQRFLSSIRSSLKITEFGSMEGKFALPGVSSVVLIKVIKSGDVYFPLFFCVCVCFSKLADVFFYYYYCCCISYQSFFRSFLQKFSLKIQSYTALWQYMIHTGIFSTSVVIIYMLLAEFSN